MEAVNYGEHELAIHELKFIILNKSSKTFSFKIKHFQSQLK